MEKNTVLLSLEDYNGLRDFEKKISEGYIEVYGNCGLRTYYTTKDKAIKEIAAHNKDLKDKIKELENPTQKIESSIIVLRRVKKMSIWEFMKWRRCDKGGFVLTNKG